MKPKLKFIFLFVILPGLVFPAGDIDSLKNVFKMSELQKSLIEEKQKEIVDSINYARRIQKAHLPNDKYISKKLEDLKKVNLKP